MWIFDTWSSQKKKNKDWLKKSLPKSKLITSKKHTNLSIPCQFTVDSMSVNDEIEHGRYSKIKFMTRFSFGLINFSFTRDKISRGLIIVR